jgi:DNA repair protein RadC
MTYQNPGLAERAATFGFDTLADTETLELFLGRTLRQGAKTYAQALVQRFGSLVAVVAADLPVLSGIVGAESALELKLLHNTTIRAARAGIDRRSVLSSYAAVIAYVKAQLAGLSREQFRVIFLDKKNQVIEDRLMNEGTVDHAPVYPREVAREALVRDASAVILVHNHPTGDPTPSRADIDMTIQIVEALKPLRIAVHDHLVVGRDGVASFKALGLM